MARLIHNRRTFFLFLGILWILLSLSSASATYIFYDGTFDTNTWDHTLYTYGNGGTQIFSHQVDGGNPESYLRITNTVNGIGSGTVSAMEGFFLNTNAVYNPSVLGPISTIDYSQDAIMFSGFGAGQGSFLAIAQDGKLYFSTSSYFTTPYTEWTHLSLSGIGAGDFAFFDPPTRTLDAGEHPDFSASGQPLTFGFSRSNTTRSVSGYTIVGGIDNWSVTVNPPIQHTPEPVTLLMLGSGLLGIAGFRKRLIRS